MNNYIKILISSILVIVCGCNNEKSTSNGGYDTTEMSTYFETQKLVVNESNGKVEIKIYESGLLAKEKNKKGFKWSTGEAFCSIGALMFSEKVKQTDKIDSIIVEIQNDGKWEKYSYSIADLRKMKKYTDVCVQFANLIGSSKYKEATLLLGNDIKDKTSDKELENMLSSIFSQKGIKNTGIIAFNISDNLATIYFNIYFLTEEAQTFTFVFKMDGDDKIAGIRDMK